MCLELCAILMTAALKGIVQKAGYGERPVTQDFIGGRYGDFKAEPMISGACFLLAMGSYR
jgi:hypothetical protein